MKKIVAIIAIAGLALVVSGSAQAGLLQGVHMPSHYMDDPGSPPGTWEYNCMDFWGKSRCIEHTQDGGGIIGYLGQTEVTATSIHNGDAGTANTQYQSHWWPMVWHDANKYYLIYDLGAEYDLETAYLWQGGQADHTDVGLREFNLLVSSDGSSWTQIGPTHTLAKHTDPDAGGPLYDDILAQTFPLVATARYVQIDSVSSWHGNGWIGLAEAGFGEPLPPVAEPAGLGLVGLALLAVRKRRS